MKKEDNYIMKLKRVLALTLAAAMTFSLTACGGSSDEGAAPAAESAGNDEAEAPAPADEASDDAAEAPAATDSAVPTYSQINVGTDYTNLTASIKWIHHKTDREEDGTIAAMIADFNTVYPNIEVTTEGVTDYAEDALLRLSTGDWGDIMFIPAVDKSDLGSYFQPLDTLDNMSKEINFADAWEFG